jgi:hypothetical protein
MQRILNDTTSRHTAKTYIDSLFPHQVLLTTERISGNLAHIALFYERLNIGWKNQHRRLLRPFHNRDYANPAARDCSFLKVSACQHFWRVMDWICNSIASIASAAPSWRQ